VADVWVVDASPLIALERIGCVHLLEQLAAEVVLPAAVIREVGVGPRSLAPAGLCRHRAVVVDVIHPVVAAWDLGSGESEVISWAVSQTGSVAVLDDRAARRCATALGVRAFGTLRVLLDGKAAGLVPAVAPLIEGIRRSGIFLSDALLEKVLELAGESK
jgi:predicted nucleic acid-binding protein